MRNKWWTVAVGLILLTGGIVVAGETHGDKSDHGWLGVSLVVEERLDGAADPSAVRVAGVVAGGGAEQAGLETDDRIVEIDGRAIDRLSDIHAVLGRTRPGDAVSLTYERDGNLQTVEVILGNRAAHHHAGSKRFGVVLEHTGPFLGVRVQALGPQLATYFGVERGLLITEVFDDSAANAAGLEAGDVVLEIGDRPVVDQGALRGALAAYEIGEQVPIRLQRRGASITRFVEMRAVEPESIDLLRLRGDHLFHEQGSGSWTISGDGVVELVGPGSEATIVTDEQADPGPHEKRD